MQPLATSSDATARALVAAHDRSTPLTASSSRKRRVSTASSPSTALHKSVLVTDQQQQQQQQQRSAPLLSSTTPDDADPATIALWRLARNARTPLQQRHLSDHLISHARDRRNGATHASHAPTRRSLALSPLVHDALVASTAGHERVRHSYDPFPPQRYAFVREWELPPLHATTTCASSKPSPHRGTAAKHQVLHAVVATDRVDSKLVVLTCLAKAIVTKWYVRIACESLVRHSCAMGDHLIPLALARSVGRSTTRCA